MKQSLFHKYLLKIPVTAVVYALLLLLMCDKVYAGERIQEISKPVVIVIDPGHGGENLGTKEFLSKGEDFLEKKMTMVTALAMYDELQKYEGVEVYLTHTDDKDMSLKNRAKFAQTKKADFLFSIHYNASENHTWYGSEVWLSTELPYHNYGYQFGYNHLNNMKEIGLFVRGVKTRISETGSGDYYGILRESSALGIPAVIIEHCHVDNDNDVIFCDTKEKLQEFGRLDAISVAQYFNLMSKEQDFSDFNGFVEINSDTTQPEAFLDQTIPEYIEIELSEIDYTNKQVTVHVSAKDSESPLMYYTYSLDNGITFSKHLLWPDANMLTGEYPEEIIVKLNYSNLEGLPKIIFRVYNKFEKMAESNQVSIPNPTQPEKVVNENLSETGIYEQQSIIVAQSENVQTAQNNLQKILLVCLCIATAVFITLLIIKIRNKLSK